MLQRIPRATPLRSQIAMELRGHIAERVAHGHSVDEALRQLGDPTSLAESYLSAVPLVSARFWARVAAKAVDWLLWLVPVAVLTWSAWQFSSAVSGIAFIAGLVSLCLLAPVYTVIAEYWFGQTVGKYLLGLCVVRESGARIGFGQAVVRQLPGFLQVTFIDAMFALFTEKNQRAFELLSKTRVVLARA